MGIRITGKSWGGGQKTWWEDVYNHVGLRAGDIAGQVEEQSYPILTFTVQIVMHLFK